MIDEDTDLPVSLLRKALRLGSTFLWFVGWSVAAILWGVGWALLRSFDASASLNRGETTGDGFRQWFLLEGDRRVIIGGLLATVFFGSVVLGLTRVIGVRNGTFVTTMFSTIIAGLFSFVPIVIGTNQLALARLFGAPGTPDSIRGKFDSLRTFRANVEALAPDVTVAPTESARFLAVVVRTIEEQICEVHEAVADGTNPGLQREVDEYLHAVLEEVEGVSDRLRGEDPSLFEMLVVLMGEDFSELINAARRVQVMRAEDLSATAEESLDELIEALVAADVLREYFKIVYFQQELAKLSRLLAYSGIAALLTSMLIVMTYSGETAPGNGTGFLLLIGLSLTIAFSPFAVLFAYVLRIATIVERTAAPGGFAP